MYTTDSIKVTMVGTAGAGSPDIAAKPGLVSGVVTFAISKAAIAANIGNANKTFTLEYEVTRAGVKRGSTKLTVTVTPIPSAELQKTLIRINQANAATKILDLSTVTAGGKTRVGVWPFITSPWPVWLKLTGQKNDGTAHSVVVWNGAGGSAVNLTWITAGFLEGNVSYNNLKEFGHGKELTMEFKAAFSTSKVEANAIVFPLVKYTVSSLPATFPVPKLTQATGSGATVTLAPMNAQNGGTVSVEYTPMYTSDSIKVTMVGTAGAGSPDIAAKPGLVSGVVTFDIPKAAIAANIGNANKTFTLEYEVTRAGVKRGSTKLTVTVTPIPQANLPRPLINGIAHDGTLDVFDLPANAKLIIAPWPLQYSGMKIWLTYHCGGANPNPYVIWTGQQHHTSAGLEYGAPIDWLKTCPHGNQVWIDFKVAYDPNASEAGAVSFPRTVYTVKAKRVDTDEFDGYSEDGWRNWKNGTNLRVKLERGEYYLTSYGPAFQITKWVTHLKSGAVRVTIKYRSPVNNNGTSLLSVGSYVQHFYLQKNSNWVEYDLPVTYGTYNNEVILSFSTNLVEIASIKIINI